MCQKSISTKWKNFKRQLGLQEQGKAQPCRLYFATAWFRRRYRKKIPHPVLALKIRSKNNSLREKPHGVVHIRNYFVGSRCAGPHLYHCTNQKEIPEEKPV